MLLLVIIIFAFGIRTSWFQTFLAQKIASYLSNELNTEVRIDKVDIVFFDLVDIEGVYIEDKIKDTLLYSESVHIDIANFSLKESFVDINEVALTNARVNLKKYKNDTTYNFQHLVDYFASDKIDTTKSAPFKVNVKQVALNNISFTYQDQNADFLDHGLDYSNLAIKNLSGKFSDFGMDGGVLKANIENLKFKDQSGLILSKFTANVLYSPTLISLKNLQLGFNNSLLISDKLELITPNGAEDFAKFVHKVKFNGNIRNTKISMADIAYFVPTLNGMDTKIYINNIDLSGPVYGMRLNNTDITMLDSTIIRGNFQIPDLDHPEDAVFDDEIVLFQTTVADIQQLKLTPFLGGDDYIQLPSSMAKAGLIQLKKGHLFGVMNDFVVDGKLITGLGSVSSEHGLHFKKNLAENIYYYESAHEGLNKDIEVINLDLAAISGNPLLGITTGHISIGKGSKGLAMDELDIQFTGHFDQVELNDYAYKDINIRKGEFVNNKFTGIIDIEDDNLALNYDGYIDLNNDMEFGFKVRIDSAAINKLANNKKGILNRFESKIDVNITGTSLNEMYGGISINELKYKEGDIDFELDSMLINITRSDSIDRINMNSELFDLELAGKFDLMDLWPVIQHQLARVAGNMIDDVDISQTKNEFFNLKLDLKDINPLMQFVESEVFIAPNSTINSSYDRKKLKLKFKLKSDSVAIEGMTFTKIQLENHLDSLRANLIYEIAEIRINDSLGVKNAAIFSYVKNNKLSTNLGWDALGNVEPALFAFNTYLKENKDILTEFKPSFFFLKSQKWDINRESKLLWNSELMEFTNFDITNGDHLVNLEGKISKDPKDWLFFQVRDFELADLNGVFGGAIDMGGVLNIDGGISDVYNNIRFMSVSDIKNFVLDGELVGDLIVDNKWNKEKNSVEIKGNLKRGKKETFKFKGNYFTELEKDNIDLDLIFDYTDIGFLNVFSDPDMYTDIEGILNGKLKITGELTDPVINGLLDVVTANVQVPMFNVSFGISGGINFGLDEIIVENMTVYDQEGNNALASMEIYHDDWADWNYDITLDMESDLVSDKFLAMNTFYKEGDFYYGKAYVSGDVNIFGYNGMTEITVDTETQPGTDLKLAMYGTGDLEESSFIVFDTIVPVYNPDKLNEDNTQTESTGLIMNMDFKITKETKVTIVFDPIFNDQIEVEEGVGAISLNLDEFGEMDMFGGYTILKGIYNMNVKGLVKKQFIIGSDSKLAWSKSPYDAIIDIRASYKAKTSISPIMPAGVENENAKEEDVFATMVMSKTLMNPEIKFEISAPDASREEKDALVVLNSNQDNLNKQFFALLALDRFLSTDGKSGGGGNALEKVVEGQINEILENFDDGLTIDIGGGGQINYEKDLGEKISIKTSLGVVTGDEESAGSLIGDIVIEYRLNEDGSYTVEAFNESNQGSDAEKGPFTQGVGLHYEETFHTWHGSKLWQGLLNIFRTKENDVDIKKEKANGKKKPVKGAREKLDTGEATKPEEEKETD